MEYKFRDKVYLSTYMLDAELFDKYNFLVEDAVPIRSVFILKTNEGLKILKKVDYKIEEIEYIYEVLNHIRRSYPYIINFKQSVEGKPYVEYEGGVYVVFDLIEGRECIYENPVDLLGASRSLAKLHNASNGIKVKDIRNNLYKMDSNIIKKIKELNMCRDFADLHVNKTDFDRLFLEYADYYIEQANLSLKELQESDYRKLCRDKYVLCHHDLAHHNIIVDNEDNYYFVDFDYCMIDLPYHDLCNFITKAIKHNMWNVDMADTILQGYSMIRKLEPNELKVLYAYLLFPQDFYDITISYYMKTRGWDEDEFFEKLKRKAEYKEDREKFLKDFKELIQI
ncbi:CotS family spore coat protein [Thermobrachium celere]|uniref:Spore coat protein S n=1 Tax=Thermobrachium celere DSM 8682 TaxID=941824 RepID=R7RMF8_9CLOT|nr:CotS family spore coat protein [Thermobrachium celere]CDF57224.1 Spore coat protein S [Thermobrachium celere DSM 8682]